MLPECSVQKDLSLPATLSLRLHGGCGRQQEGRKDQAEKLLENRDIKSNPGFASPPLCFVLGNLTAALDSVKHACPCGKISF